MNSKHVWSWACTSFGGCAASFVDWSMPYVQWLSAFVALIAGLRALWVSRRNHK